jgi:hypothetical protein
VSNRLLAELSKHYRIALRGKVKPDSTRMKRHADLFEAYVGGLYYSARGSATMMAADTVVVDRWLHRVLAPIAAGLSHIVLQNRVSVKSAERLDKERALQTLHNSFTPTLRSPLPGYTLRSCGTKHVVNCTAFHGGVEW